MLGLELLELIGINISVYVMLNDALLHYNIWLYFIS